MGREEVDSVDSERFAAHCEWAASVVATWPAWKRNCLSWWSDNKTETEGSVKTRPEPGPLVCIQCGRHETEPFDVGDACVCGGQFQSVQYGWLCSVGGDRFEPMDYGEQFIEGVDEPMETSLLRRGARMAAFDSKSDAEEALRRSSNAMRATGSDVFQRATFCLVRIISREKR